MLLAREPSEARVDALRNYLKEHTAPVLPLLTDTDLRAHFHRQPFSGAVVRCPRTNVHEWLLLLGDAAHSVIPPTCEGVNAGLEDVRILTEIIDSGTPALFETFNTERMPDLRALGVYAVHLRDNISSEDPTRSVTNVVLRVIGTLGARFGKDAGQVEQRLFGPDAGLESYRGVIGPWIRSRDRWTPRVRPVVQRLQRVRRLLPSRRRRTSRVPAGLGPGHSQGIRHVWAAAVVTVHGETSLR